MDTYFYRAAKSGGEVISGTLPGEDERAVVSQLRAQGLLPLEIRRGNGPVVARPKLRWNELGRFFTSRVRAAHLAAFTQQMGTLLRAGVPVDRALEILCRVDAKSPLQPVVARLLEDVKKGKSLSEAMGSHPRVFSPFFRNLVRAGEESASVDDVLLRIGDTQKRLLELRSQVLGALIYPTILLLVSLVSVFVLLTYVVPKFVDMFVELGIELPLATRILMAVGSFFQNFGWLLVGGAALGFLAVRRLLRSESVRERWERWVLAVPVLGSFVRANELARCTRTLATLLHGGIPLLRAVGIARTTVGSRVLAQGLAQAEHMLRSGHSLSSALSRNPFFSPISIQMIRVGEESGRMGDMLAELAAQSEHDLAVIIKRAMTLVEPVIILTMGLLVGFVVLSMLSAVFGMHDIQF
jgi:general secretion pathway protein F